MSTNLNMDAGFNMDAAQTSTPQVSRMSTNLNILWMHEHKLQVRMPYHKVAGVASVASVASEHALAHATFKSQYG